MELEVVYSSRYVIATLIYSNPPRTPWLFFFVYGPPSRAKRKQFWELMESMVSTFSGPRAMIGDFNSIKNAGEKRGGKPATKSSVNSIRTFITNSAAIDLGFKGPPFTWTNKREGLDNIKERLDQCLCNQEWQLLFPKAGVTHLCATN